MSAHGEDYRCTGLAVHGEGKLRSIRRALEFVARRVQQSVLDQEEILAYASDFCRTRPAA